MEKECFFFWLSTEFDLDIQFSWKEADSFSCNAGTLNYNVIIDLHYTFLYFQYSLIFW